jgi:hypothetical protein
MPYRGSFAALPAGVKSVGANESLGPANFPTHHLRRKAPPTIATALSSTTTLASSRKERCPVRRTHNVIIQMRENGEDLGNKR